MLRHVDGWSCRTAGCYIMYPLVSSGIWIVSIFDHYCSATSPNQVIILKTNRYYFVVYCFSFTNIKDISKDNKASIATRQWNNVPLVYQTLLALIFYVIGASYLSKTSLQLTIIIEGNRRIDETKSKYINNRELSLKVIYVTESNYETKRSEVHGFNIEFKSSLICEPIIVPNVGLRRCSLLCIVR